MLTFTQAIGVIFAAVMIIINLKQRVKKKISTTEFIFWLATWSVFAAGLASFDRIDFTVRSMFDITAEDFLMFFAILFLLATTYKNHRENKKNAKKIEDLAQSIVIEKVEK